MDTNQKSQSISQLLADFGLDEKEQQVYLLLLKMDWSTALQISRVSDIKRPTLYRVLESLMKKGLVEQQIDDKTTYYSAANPKSFETLLIEQEKKTTELKASLASLQSQLQILQVSPEDSTSVRFYRGVRGLQTIEWQLSETKHTQLLIFGIDKWHEVLGQEFAEAIRQRCVHNHIQVREILNDTLLHPISADATVNWTLNKEYVLNCFRHRYVPKEILDIQNEVYIINHSVIFYSFKEAEPIGVEIIGQGYAQLMRSLFELTWQQAKIIDDFGGE